MSAILLDLGNTRLKAAVLHEGQPREIAAFALAGDEFEAAFSTWLRAHPAATAWLASVAPEALLARVLGVIAQRGVSVLRVETQARALGVRIAYPEPARLGVDRWLNLLAAHARDPSPTLVASVGSALVIDALLADGTHLGGLIAAPPDASRAALLQRAPRLDVPRGTVARFAIDTADAIESGALLAATALIERSLHELERRAGGRARLLLTGGGAPPLRPWLTDHDWVPDLPLHGLAAWVARAHG